MKTKFIRIHRVAPYVSVQDWMAIHLIVDGFQSGPTDGPWRPQSHATSGVGSLIPIFILSIDTSINWIDIKNYIDPSHDHSS